MLGVDIPADREEQTAPRGETLSHVLRFQRQNRRVVTRRQSMPQHKKWTDQNSIAVVGKIFSVIEYLAERVDKQQDISFTQIFKELPYSRTTVHGILHSLEKLDYVEKVGAASHYRLTPKFFELSEQAVNHRHLQALAQGITVT
jgi:DNA-binding MarR family transcriptional regulator